MREGKDVEEDQVHERDDHQDAQSARETRFAEDLPVGNDDDERDHQGTEQQGEKMVMRSVEIDVSR